MICKKHQTQKLILTIKDNSPAAETGPRGSLMQDMTELNTTDWKHNIFQAQKPATLQNIKCARWSQNNHFWKNSPLKNSVCFPA